MEKLELSRLLTSPKTGQEPFHRSKQELEQKLSLIDFWRWGCSDLIENTYRGCLAEFIVASALGCLGCLRNSWGCHDVEMANGITIQVKSSAYLQSWYQKTPSIIKFDIEPTLAWNPDTNAFEGTRKRHSFLYIFALFHHKDKKSLDPMDIDQWIFYVIPTKVLDEKVPEQHSIGLGRLRKLGALECRYDGLQTAVDCCRRQTAPPGQSEQHPV